MMSSSIENYAFRQALLFFYFFVMQFDSARPRVAEGTEPEMICIRVQLSSTRLAEAFLNCPLKP